jgi:hypothetical protein
LSAATVNRRARSRLTPEQAEAQVALRAEQAERRLKAAKLSLARKRLALGEDVDLDAEVGDVDALVAEAITAADDLVVWLA